MITAVEGNLKHSPKNLWWTKLIPRFLYPIIVKRLKQNPINVECEVKTLSYIIENQNPERIDLLKIDCEGNELNVINGIKPKDWPIIKQIIIEVNDIPRTKNGKIVELAVKNIIEGNEIKNIEALANPEVLNQYKNLKELNY